MSLHDWLYTFYFNDMKSMDYNLKRQYKRLCKILFPMPISILNIIPLYCFLFAVSKRTSARPFVASCLSFSTFRDDIFMLGGQDAVVVWRLNEDTRKLSQTTVTLGKVKRNITNLLVRHVYYKTYLYSYSKTFR